MDFNRTYYKTEQYIEHVNDSTKIITSVYRFEGKDSWVGTRIYQHSYMRPIKSLEDVDECEKILVSEKHASDEFIKMYKKLQEKHNIK